MIRAFRAAAWAALALSAACGPAAPESPTGLEAAAPRAAWTGEDPASGTRVVLEPLAPPAPSAPATVSEAEVIGRAAVLPPGAAWYRLLEAGEASRGDRGAVRWDGGSALEPPAARGGADARTRLLYLALVEGGEAAGVDSGVRSRLLAGPRPPAGAIALWERAGMRLELAPRTWSARERADFLGDSVRRAASESGAADAPPPEHE